MTAAIARPDTSTSAGPEPGHAGTAVALDTLRAAMDDAVATSSDVLAGVHPHFDASARNLLQYLALRRRDLRPLQERLAECGLSSLGRAESHVAAAVDAVRAAFASITGVPSALRPASAPVPDGRAGRAALAAHTRALLGPSREGCPTRIMVTMPSEAASDFLLVQQLVEAGMDVMRINCAHDGPAAWARMIANLRRAEQAVGRTCRVTMDLGGPKLRTGPLEPGPAVLRIRPARDVQGRVVAPARVWFTAADAPVTAPSPADATLPVPGRWLRGLAVGDRLVGRDARRSLRAFTVVDRTADGVWAEARRTCYAGSGMRLRIERAAGGTPVRRRWGTIGALPVVEQPLVLARGDVLLITRDQVPGRRATCDAAGRVLTPAMIGCTLPEVFDEALPGETVWFDDGRIGGVIESVAASRVAVRITHARARGERLRADKGINLPDTAVRLPALTAQDLRDLSFVAAHADVVALSFANDPRDVAQLQSALHERGPKQPAIVLKIETKRGFAALPALLLQAMRSPCCGVMIARGDLAVECGFERLAEVQEEILWICEAAHVPVIWATQVLESLAKDGLPSRAEITDAAMGHRAECVMLNKGPHVVAAVAVLDDILRRMHAHQDKKRSMLRELQLAHALGPSRSPVP